MNTMDYFRARVPDAVVLEAKQQRRNEAIVIPPKVCAWVDVLGNLERKGHSVISNKFVAKEDVEFMQKRGYRVVKRNEKDERSDYLVSLKNWNG